MALILWSDLTIANEPKDLVVHDWLVRRMGIGLDLLDTKALARYHGLGHHHLRTLCTYLSLSLSLSLSDRSAPRADWLTEYLIARSFLASSIVTLAPSLEREIVSLQRPLARPRIVQHVLFGSLFDWLESGDCHLLYDHLGRYAAVPHRAKRLYRH
mgnify:CR=1 FL=1